MNRILILSANDFRMVFRDPLLRIFLFMPLLIFAVVKWVLPMVFSLFPVIQAYDYVIMMWACMQASTMFGFISGFIFLEEKDENVFSALRVTPVTASMLITFRMILGVAISVLINWLLLEFGGILNAHQWQVVLVSFQYGVLAPILALLLAVFAKNKVEGLAQFKIYNLVINLPILIYFLDFKSLHSLAFIPTYWSFRCIEAMAVGGNFTIFFLIGLCLYFLYLAVLIRIFERRIF